jgi:hypothetical protein
MKCKSCKAEIKREELKQGKCPLCKKPAGKKYRYPARPFQKGKSKRMKQKATAVNSMTCHFTGGKFNRDGYCTKAGIAASGTICKKCLK